MNCQVGANVTQDTLSFFTKNSASAPSKQQEFLLRSGARGRTYAATRRRVTIFAGAEHFWRDLARLARHADVCWTSPPGSTA